MKFESESLSLVNSYNNSIKMGKKKNYQNINLKK